MSTIAGKTRSGSDRQVETLAESAHRPPRLVALAVQQPVDPALEPVAEREGDQRGDSGREERDPEAMIAADEGRDPETTTTT